MTILICALCAIFVVVFILAMVFVIHVAIEEWEFRKKIRKLKKDYNKKLKAIRDKESRRSLP